MSSRNPPLAGRPPFATDEPDDLFDQPQARPRPRPRKPEVENDYRDTTYAAYESYFDDATRQSGVDAVGMGFMNGLMDDSDDSDDDRPPQPAKQVAPPAALQPARRPQPASAPVSRPPPVYSPPPTRRVEPSAPLAAPQPRRPAAIAAITPVRPPPGLVKSPSPPPPRTIADPKPSNNDLRVQIPIPQTVAPPPRNPQTTLLNVGNPTEKFGLPTQPHVLQPPPSPITPVFARPSKSPAPTTVKFSSDAILRGNSEETLIPRSTEKGNDFWRRFSMVVKEESTKNPKEKNSAWLRKTQEGRSRLSVWVWIIGVIILVAIGGGIGAGWYFTHNKPDYTTPIAIGGSANNTGVTTTSSSSASVKSIQGVSSSPHVSATRTLNDRSVRTTVLPASVTPLPIRRRHPRPSPLRRS